MRLPFLAAALCLSACAAVADPAPLTPPAEYTLTLKGEDVVLIANALAVRPYQEVADLMARIRAQVAKEK